MRTYLCGIAFVKGRQALAHGRKLGAPTRLSWEAARSASIGACRPPWVRVYKGLAVLGFRGSRLRGFGFSGFGVWA